LKTGNAIAATEMITSAFDLPIGSVSVEATADRVASRARLLVIQNNPLHHVLPWPGPTLDLPTGVAHVGLYADGGPVPFRFYSAAGDHCTRSLPASRRRQVPVSRDAARRGNALRRDRAVGDRPAGRTIPASLDRPPRLVRLNMDEAGRMLAAALRVKQARQRYLARVEWVDDNGRNRTRKESFDRHRKCRSCSLVIDEAHNVLAIDEYREIVQLLAQEGRKTGIALVLVTQFPSAEQLGKSLLHPRPGRLGKRGRVPSGEPADRHHGIQRCAASRSGTTPPRLAGRHQRCRRRFTLGASIARS